MTATAATRLARLLALVPWLIARPGISWAEAAAHFEVTEDTLLADLGLLTCSGPGTYHGELVDIAYDEGTITVQDPQSLTRPLRLTTEEAAALLVGLRLLAQVPGGHDPALVDRVAATLENAAGSAAAGVAAVSVALELPAEPAIVAQVRRAVEERRVVRIRYAGAAADQESTREVDPIALLSVNGRPYLSGWCRSAQALRTFRLDRVRSATVLDQPAAVPDQAGGPDLGVGGLRPQGPPVTLELAPGARWVADEYPIDAVQDLDDGWIRVTLPVSDPRWITRLLLRLGGSARVVAPPEIAAGVEREARLALAWYD